MNVPPTKGEQEEEEVLLSEVQREFFQMEIHWEQCYRPSQFQFIINLIHTTTFHISELILTISSVISRVIQLCRR